MQLFGKHSDRFTLISTSLNLTQTDPRDALRHARPLRYIQLVAQCDKQATVVSRLLTTLATIDVPWRNIFQSQSLEKKLQRDVSLFLEILVFPYVGPPEACIRWGTYGRHLSNTFERSMLGGDGGYHHYCTATVFLRYRVLFRSIRIPNDACTSFQ